VTATELERYLADAQSERARLEAAIDATRARCAAAEQRGAHAEAVARTEMSALVEATRQHVAELEAEHRHAVASIQADAQAEATRVLADARGRGEALRASTAPPSEPHVDEG
jgi:predicted  nucleic acid-binding Zn-ribbon protein